MVDLTLPGLTGTVSYVGDPVSSDLFGANFLFDRDGGTEAGTISETFDAFAEEVDLGTVRYPGGTLAEVVLDLSEPNSLDADFSQTVGTRTEATVGVSDFLDYTASIDASATFVLPTYRFLTDEVDESGNRMVDPALESSLRSYVSFVLSEASAKGVTVAGFEIGNEWYVDNSSVFGFQMSPVEYGRVASYIATVVDQEIAEFNATHDAASQIDPDIVVQVGPGGAAELYTPDGDKPPADYTGPVVSATELIFNQFTTMEAKAAVDGVLSHRYLTGSDSSVSGWAYQPSKTWAALAAATIGFGPQKIYVTEWNVAARNIEEQGLKQVDSMVELVREMAIAGVDHANVWAVEQNNKTRMIKNTGLGAEVYGGLTLGGVAFDMMATQLKGTRVISGASDISGVEVNAFGSPSKNVYFLSNRSESDRMDSITLQATSGGAHHVTVYEITSEADGTPVVTIRTLNLTSAATQIPLEFSANETMMIVVAKGTSGTMIEGYDQFDNLTGSTYSDTVLGGGGDDTISGLAGNDSLAGETGNDFISGGDGNDSLSGDSGADQLDGGSGNDTLVGGSGDDTLVGGVGIDVASYRTATQGLVLDLGAAKQVAGGFGADSLSGIEGLEGGSGNDRLIGNASANILLGGLGNDTLAGGAGNDMLTGGQGIDTADYSTSTVAATVNLGLTTAQAVLGSETDTLQQIENVIGTGLNDVLTGDLGANRIEGGAGRDVITGGGGADALFGDAGDDLFVLSSFGDHAAGEQIVGGAGVDELRYTGTTAGTLVLGEGVDVERVVIGTGSSLAAGATTAAMSTLAVQRPSAGSTRITVPTITGGTSTTSSGSTTTSTTGTAAINVDASALAHGVSVLGDAGGNILTGSGFNDQLDGGSGNDTLVGGSGDDTLVGGVGIDVASYRTATQGLVLDLGAAKQVAGGFGADSLSGIEGLEGGSGNDRLIGNASANILLGGLGNDTLAGGAGNDMLTGGQGIDTADYSTSTVAATVNLGLTTAQAVLGSETDTLQQIENVIGTGLNDVLTGDLGANRIEGGAGRDVITGGGGADALFGDAGDDLFVLSSFGDHAAGEQIVGGAGVDELRYTGTTAGTLVLGEGVDVERVVIGTGSSLAAGATTAAMSTLAVQRPSAGSTRITVPTITGGTSTTSSGSTTTSTTGTAAINVDASALAHGVSVLGDAGGNILTGSGFNDQLDGGSGNDTLVGGSGDDTLVGGVGIDVASYRTATQGLVLDLGAAKQVAGGFGADSLSGIEGLEGGSGNDRLIGNASANILLGGLGNDTLAGGAGNDMLTGGQGIDTADYSTSTVAATVNLGLTTAQAVLGSETDTLQQIENVIGTGLNDVLTGDLGANRIEGGAGRDVITGGGGADALFGDAGDDLFVLSSFGDHAAGEQIVGGAGVDELRYTGTTAGTLVLGEGVDVERVVIGTGSSLAAGATTAAMSTLAVQRPSAGSTRITVPTITGGTSTTSSGSTTTSTTGTAAINVDASALAHGVSVLGDAGGNILTGSGFNDQLDGGSGNDTLVGGSGDDTLVGGVGGDSLSGGSGEDVLVGGTGNDVMTGGDGSDQFVFSADGGGTDQITDFDFGDDGIGDGDVMVFDGVSLGDFQYLGEGSFTGGLNNAEAIYSDGKLLVDTDGDGTAEITLILEGLVSPDQISSDDFLFKP